jgi:tetratricopeptide (TPR) repeat protein
MGAVFVGREREIGHLRELSGRVAVVVVCGVAGVGKSALASAVASEWAGACVYRKLVDGESLASIADDVRRQLEGGVVEPQPVEEEARLADLAERIERAAALWVLDDLHVLGARAAPLLSVLGRKLRRGRVVATSREQPPRMPSGPDYGLLHLRGLDDAGARALWATLDRLYGPSSNSEPALRRAAGNPLLLRRAHSGNLDGEDPFVDVVRALSPDETSVVAALALANVRLPSQAVAALLPEDRARPVLQGLVSRMIVEVDGAGTCSVHDLFREAVACSLTADSRRAAHDAVVRTMTEGDRTSLEPIVRVRVLAEHLRALERYAELGDLLVEQAALFVRQGAAAELLGLFEAIPMARRTVRTEVARVRLLARLLELHRARAEAAELLRAFPDRPCDLLVASAQVALVTADLSGAEHWLQEALARPEIPSAVLARVHSMLAWVMTLRGFADQALLFLDGVVVREPLHRAAVELARALVFWTQGRYEESLAHLRASQAHRNQSRAAVGHPRQAAYVAVLLARTGRVEEAEASLALAEKAVASGDDRRMRAEVRLMGAMVLCERGRRVQALASLVELLGLFEAGGCVIDAFTARIWIARVRLRLGQRREALRVLDAAQRVARELGAGALVAVAEAVRSEDPFVLLAEPSSHPVPASMVAELTTARAYDAVRAAAHGEVSSARPLIDACQATANGPDFPLERALLSIAHATLERLADMGDRADARLQAAASTAVAEGVDPELVEQMVSVLGDLRVVTPQSQRMARALPIELSEASVVLDARAHELRLGDTRLHLGRQPTVRGLLYAMARRPRQELTNGELAHEIWGDKVRRMGTYDNAIRMAIVRLRALLRDTPVRIDSTDVGYRLVVPEDFVLIERGAPPSSRFPQAQ